MKVPLALEILIVYVPKGVVLPAETLKVAVPNTFGPIETEVVGKEIVGPFATVGEIEACSDTVPEKP